VDISDHLAQQCGVISRRQLLACGADEVLIARKLRRREWARVHPGVYVDHTGPLTWQQRAWAAVLYAAPAALAGRSALHAHRVRGHATDDIHVAVPHSRKVRRRPGVRIERLTDFDTAVQTHLSPPRVRVEHALARVASLAPSDDAAVGVLADGCQSRRTTTARLADELRSTTNLPRRGLLLEILDDVATGALSVLERRFLLHVERAHRLPRGRRQQLEQTPSGAVHRDVEYVEQRLLVEVDGRLGHELALDRSKDLDRDILAATTGRLTLRVGWGQVLQPCRLAGALAAVLTARGWTGSVHACGEGCSLA
jgi:very-short-patch-repair endonuclease